MLNMLIWIVIGGLIGLAGSYLLHMYTNPGLGINIVTGIIGAVIGGFLLAPLLSYSSFNPVAFSYPAMMMAILGALSLVPTLHLARQSHRRG
jgi:uncharacterized membrane protein YeaQ/YmgE (transglycosylase-associated protein family)